MRFLHSNRQDGNRRDLGMCRSLLNEGVIVAGVYWLAILRKAEAVQRRDWNRAVKRTAIGSVLAHQVPAKSCR